MPHDDGGASRWQRKRLPPCRKLTPPTTTPNPSDALSPPHTDATNGQTEQTVQGSDEPDRGRDLPNVVQDTQTPVRPQLPRLPRFSAGNKTDRLRFVRMFVEPNSKYLCVHLGNCYARLAHLGDEDHLPRIYAELDELIVNHPHDSWEHELLPWNIYLSPSVQGRDWLKKHVRAKLIERYIPDTTKVGKWYFRRKVPEFSLLEESDIIAAAITGMVQCVDKYNPIEWKLTFMQFANAKGLSRIQGAIKDSLRILMDCTRTMSGLRRIISLMMEGLRQEIGRKPSVSDFCERYGEEYRPQLEDALFSSRVYNQSRATGDDGESTDQMSTVQDSILPEHWQSSDEDFQLFYDMIIQGIMDPRPPVCNEKHVFTMYARYWLNWTNKQIADHPIMQCSQSRALEIRREAEGKIRFTVPYKKAKAIIDEDRQ